MSTAVSQLRAGASALLPIYPNTFDDVVRLARMAIMAGMIKPLSTGWGDEKDVETPNATEARATMIIMQGMELGIPPMQAVQLLAMINGRITAHSEAVPGLLLSNGFKIRKEFRGVEMSDDWAAVCTLTRPDGGVFVGEFSVRQAKRAKLWSPAEKITKKGKGGSTYQTDNDSPWHKYPDRLMWARALGFASKDGAADALKGLMVREEVEDMIRSEYARDITPTKQITLEIPDIPDVQDATASLQRADTVADTKAFLKMIKERIAEGYSAADIYESFGEMAERLPENERGLFDKLLEAEQ